MDSQVLHSWLSGMWYIAENNAIGGEKENKNKMENNPVLSGRLDIHKRCLNKL